MLNSIGATVFEWELWDDMSTEVIKMLANEGPRPSPGQVLSDVPGTKLLVITSVGKLQFKGDDPSCFPVYGHRKACLRLTWAWQNMMLIPSKAAIKRFLSIGRRKKP